MRRGRCHPRLAPQFSWSVCLHLYLDTAARSRGSKEMTTSAGPSSHGSDGDSCLISELTALQQMFTNIFMSTPFAEACPSAPPTKNCFIVHLFPLSLH